MQAPALVDLRRRSFIMIKILQNCTTCTSIQATQFEGIRITSVGLKLNGSQLQHWLLFIEHNRIGCKDVNVVAGLLVPMDYDCVYDSV